MALYPWTQNSSQLFDTLSVKNRKEYGGDEWESYKMDGESYEPSPSANAL